MTFDEIDYAELAWAAGLFEGEGCFYFRKNPRSLVAQLVTTDKDVIDKFLRILKIGKITGPVTIKNNKPYWTWRVCTFEEFQYIACLFWKHLGNRRKNKLKESLHLYVNQPMKQRHSIKRLPIKLTNDQILEIKNRIKNKDTYVKIAYDFSVSHSLISLIANGHRHQGGAL